MPIDFALPPAQLRGDIAVLTSVEADPDVDPNTVLEIDREWYLRPHWWVDGTAAYYLGGTWHLEVNVESMGPGVEKTLATIDIPTTALGPGPITHRLEYKPVIRIPSRHEDPLHSIPQDGAYKLVVVLTYTTPFNQHGRIAGFTDGPMLQFYHFDTPNP